MRKIFCYLVFFVFLHSFFSCGQGKKSHVLVEVSKRKMANFLGTEAYETTIKEKIFSKKVNDIEENTDFLLGKDYFLNDKVGKYVGWFGIVREIRFNAEKNFSSLLVEMKYFDGMTDLHLQVVSICGAGDFSAVIPGKAAEINLLSLIRVYGQIIYEKDGIPEIKAEYIRVWPWSLFAFMDYGRDRSNPKWVKLRKLGSDDIYTSRPDRVYYENVLGEIGAPAGKDVRSGPIKRSHLLDLFFYRYFFSSMSIPLTFDDILATSLQSLKSGQYQKALDQLSRLKIFESQDGNPYLWDHYFLF